MHNFQLQLHQAVQLGHYYFVYDLEIIRPYKLDRVKVSRELILEEIFVQNRPCLVHCRDLNASVSAELMRLISIPQVIIKCFTPVPFPS